MSSTIAGASSESALERYMRDWLLILTPLAVVLYFVMYPDQLEPFVYWVNSTVSWLTGWI
jgi:hypothetical protein